jgi:hypothetical protein
MKNQRLEIPKPLIRGRFTAFPVTLPFSFDVWPLVGLGLKVRRTEDLGRRPKKSAADK